MSVEYVSPENVTIVVDTVLLSRAADVLSQAKGLIIMAGAGFGADSGIPTYRTNEDFWNAHPKLRHTRLGIPEMSNRDLFMNDPRLAWGFMASRRQLYRSTRPHLGYNILKQWGETMEEGYFVFTSNVDRHFFRAGFSPDRIVELHGSLEYLQCSDTNVNSEVWSTPENFNVTWDPETLRASLPLPTFRQGDLSTTSGKTKNDQTQKIDYEDLNKESVAREAEKATETHLLRPNIKLFNDYMWINEHILKMEKRFHDFIRNNLAFRGKRFVIVEVGVGVTVKTIRPTTEMLIDTYPDLCTLIRINPIEPEVRDNTKHISLRMTGLEALKEIDLLYKRK